MKRTFVGILVLAIMLLCVPNLASATDASYNDRAYHIDELGISFDMPEGYDVITRDNEPSAEAVKRIDMESDEIQKIMQDTDLYLYALSPYNNNVVIRITSFSDDYSKEIGNLSEYSLKDLDTKLNQSIANGDYTIEDNYINESHGSYNLDISRTVETFNTFPYYLTSVRYNNTLIMEKYSTVYDGRNLYITIDDLSGEGFTNDDYLDLIPVLMSMVYEQPEEPLQKASAMPSQETLAPLPTTAIDNTYFIDYLGITVSFPDNYVVITRDMEESKAALEALDITPDAAKSAMFSNCSYLDATNMDTFSSILVTSLSDEFSAQIGNLSNYSVSEINKMLEDKPDEANNALNRMAESAVAPGQDVKVDTSAVNINGIPFFKYVVTVNSEYIPTIMYRTVLDGKYVNFQTSPLNLEDGLLDSDIEGLMYVMERLTFPSATPPPKESTDVESIINRINESESKMAAAPPLPTYSPVPKTSATATSSFWSKYLTEISKYIIAVIILNVIIWPIAIHNKNKKKKKKDDAPPFLDTIDTADSKINSTESSSSSSEDKTTPS